MENWKNRASILLMREQKEEGSGRVKRYGRGEGDRGVKARKIRISFKTARVKEATIFHGTCELVFVSFPRKLLANLAPNERRREGARKEERYYDRRVIFERCESDASRCVCVWERNEA